MSALGQLTNIPAFAPALAPTANAPTPGHQVTTAPNPLAVVVNAVPPAGVTALIQNNVQATAADGYDGDDEGQGSDGAGDEEVSEGSDNGEDDEKEKADDEGKDEGEENGTDDDDETDVDDDAGYAADDERD
ncbi:hypothetical protein BDN72DRAFT_846851 [Pluteus cervinus]|uniref:Uncharacterized protein n=1 Tax=Pluteus cervinus TaxID=181527 RepID=A0ACD3AES4_9AGAR|nr:hypothetical protein BDN72DRAFT_846851 [Pluteus cervinus]